MEKTREHNHLGPAGSPRSSTGIHSTRTLAFFSLSLTLRWRPRRGPFSFHGWSPLSRHNINMDVKKFTVNVNVEKVKNDLQACRVCLSTELKLLSLKNGSMQRIYTEFSGLPITSTDGLPQYICQMCCALLRKSTKFKQKCKTAYNLLLDHLQTQPLTKSNIHTIDRTYLRSPLTYTGIIECNCEPDETLQPHKEVFCKVEPVSNEDANDDVHDDGYSDVDDFYENSDIKLDDIGDIKSAKIPKNALSGDILAKFSEEYNFDVKLMLSKEKVLDVEKRKEHAKYKKAKYRCKLCYTGFKTESTFQNHKTLHDPSLPYECEFCHRRFKTPQKRRHHLDKQHRYKFVCQQCGTETRDIGGAREHYRSHAGVSYECEHCQMKFDKYKSRINHIRIYHGSVPCDICHMKFSSQAGLVAHKGRAHKECFKCAVCLVQFHNANALRRHAELTAQNCGKDIMPCTQCGDSFTEELTLKQHIYNKHRPDGYKGCQPSDDLGLTRRRGYRKAGTKQDLICEICAMGGFKYEWYLRDHQLRKHFDDRPFSCDNCGKKFKTKTCVMTHINRVHNERRYVCPLPLCNKAFRQSHHLTCHLRSHSNEKAFSCRTCQKQFKHPESVREHERTVHEGKPGRVRS
ncbi:zinc-finger associated domain (zf-AD) domain-containing protein [Phthorimaea operculella]|nr:zinc-finger associated domain (zf-AD) domain-containing protein [Phthorimaea operculella]